MLSSSTNVEKLAKKLQSLAEDVYFLPQDSLDILWQASEQAELVTLLSQVSLSEYDELVQIPYPENQGRDWDREDILTLDSLLKDSKYDVSSISSVMDRNLRSIVFKGCELIALKVDKGYTLERAFSVYLNKITSSNYFDFLIFMLKQTRKTREYFYTIDIHGQLFLADTKHKNFTSCFKDPKFLNFFYNRLKRNTHRYTNLFPYLSICSNEINYIRPALSPIVFHALRQDNMLYAGNLSVKFEPELVTVNSDGYFYYPFDKSSYYPQDELKDIAFKNVNNQVDDWGIEEYLEKLENQQEQREIIDGKSFGLLKSSLVLNELAPGLENEYFIYKGKKFPFNWI
ncbi:hypothetical protein HDV01_002709 [Terramyces sp. JEL0728]|nr:hypothetical protein HDV01_002709 [Terramyces sp. JEL0728]